MTKPLALAPLPVDASQAIEHLAIAPGLYLGIVTSDSARMFRGTIHGDAIDWSTAWSLPPPPPYARSGLTWSECGGLTIAEDQSRLAINLVEYQGGSHGVYVGRFGETPTYVPSPTDSDIRFGVPLILRGSELFSHDMHSLFHFRLPGPTTELALDDLTNELGWLAALDDAGETLVLDGSAMLIFLERAGTGSFRRGRVVRTASPLDGLAMVSDGRALALVENEVRMFGRDGMDMLARTVAIADARGVGLTTRGTHAVFSVGDDFVAVDVASGREQRIELPPGWSAAETASSADQLLVACAQGVAVYALT